MKKLILIFALIFTLGFSLALAEPNYSFYLTHRDEMSHKRYWATIARNGDKWSLRLPLADFEAKNLAPPQFSETDEGFSFFFSWGGGRWFQEDTFFFRDEEDEPVLYKVQNNTDEYGHTKDGDFDLVDQYTEFSEINPPIKISRLGTEKTENAMQNILLEKMENFDGILIATTNLAVNMDAAFVCEKLIVWFAVYITNIARYIDLVVPVIFTVDVWIFVPADRI